jgi:signal transduction histidine kinase
MTIRATGGHHSTPPFQHNSFFSTIDADVLRQFPIFAAFPLAQLNHLAREIEQVFFEADEIIFQAGEHTENMYLILDGRVRIHRATDDGEVIELVILETGQIFGELALFSSEPRMATATTLTPCTLLVVTRTLLLEVVRHASPETVLNLLGAMSQQIRETYERNFQGILAQHTLEAQMEVERQRSLTQMVAGVAHEINTPLGVVSLGMSIIERELADIPGADPKDMGRLAESIALMKRNIERAHKLIQDFKKVSVSQLSDAKESMNLPDVVQEIIGLAEIQLKRNGIMIHFDNQVLPSAETWIGYRGYLSQILLNLLTNIDRYAYPDGIGGYAHITLNTPSKDLFMITVRDYGQGIPQEHLAHIFEPFFTTGRSIGGTGLGMTIVHNLVTQALHGSIHIDSEIGKGTEITLTFPRQIPD